jgi:hypothetical protein
MIPLQHTFRRSTLLFRVTGLVFFASLIHAQDAPAPAKPSPAPPPVREVPLDVNTGTGFSVEPIYFYSFSAPGIRKGTQNASTRSGDLDFPDAPDRILGGVVTIPAGKTAAVRASYFQGKAISGLTLNNDLNIFGSDLATGDLVSTEYKLTNFKLSYDYLTYFFKRGSTEFRVKTLWGAQYFSMNSVLDVFTPLSDGTFAFNSLTKDRSIIYPDFGLGIEHIIGPHVRWEAKASGFAYPRKSVLGEAEASIAFRFGHFELIGGGRMFHFKTAPDETDNYLSGTLYGPYAGLRFYFKGTKKPGANK